MVWVKRILLGILALVALGLALIFASGNGPTLRLIYDFAFGAPDFPFDPAAQAPAPDYALARNWAALPDREDPADLVPQGVPPGPVQGQAPVDVFFIHPTGFLKASSWTFDMNPDTSTEENTRWMMANQASPYNGCCNVYAPRYRQATLFAYFAGDRAFTEEVLGFAYQDVARAFDYFIEHFNEGRPFIIASHSQGTHHGTRLLREKIEGTGLVQRFVAAYLIGGGVAGKQFDGLADIRLCDSPTQLRCAVHWDTYNMAEHGEPKEQDIDNVCVNPLSWRLQGGLAQRSQHVGAVLPSGEYHMALSGDDSARGIRFAAHAAPIANLAEAKCEEGRLYVSDQSGAPFNYGGELGGGYHMLDYPLFYMDIRDNARLRAATWLQKNLAP